MDLEITTVMKLVFSEARGWNYTIKQLQNTKSPLWVACKWIIDMTFVLRGAVWHSIRETTCVEQQDISS